MNSTLHLAPEWMRVAAKPLTIPSHQRVAGSPSPTAPFTPLASAGGGGGVTPTSYSAHAAPPALAVAPVETQDAAHPFRYSKGDMLQVWRTTAAVAPPPLGLEVERWDGVVREDARDPVGLHDMSDIEKKLFAGSLNSDLRRRQSQDHLSLTLPPGGLKHPLGQPSPVRERFAGSMLASRRQRDDAPSMPRRLSLTAAAGPGLGPLSPALQSPRPRNEWMARRKTGLDPRGDADDGESGRDDVRAAGDPAPEKHPTPEPAAERHSAPGSTDTCTAAAPALAPDRHDPLLNGHSKTTGPRSNGVDEPAAVPRAPRAPVKEDPGDINWSYKDPSGTIQGPFAARLMQDWHDKGYFTGDLMMKRTKLDTAWTAVADWEQRGGKQFFLASFSDPPPGLAPLVMAPSPAPLQQTVSVIAPKSVTEQAIRGFPIPGRTRRVSGVDPYVSPGSNPSNSPASSFGAGFAARAPPSPQLAYESANVQDQAAFSHTRAPRFAQNDLTSFSHAGRYGEAVPENPYQNPVAAFASMVPNLNKWGQELPVDGVSFRDVVGPHMAQDGHTGGFHAAPAGAGGFGAMAEVSPVATFSQAAYPPAPRYGSAGSSLGQSDTSTSFGAIGAPAGRPRELFGRGDQLFTDVNAGVRPGVISSVVGHGLDSAFGAPSGYPQPQSLPPLSTILAQSQAQQASVGPMSAHPHPRQPAYPSEPSWSSVDNSTQARYVSQAQPQRAPSEEAPSPWGQKSEAQSTGRGKTAWYYASQVPEDDAWGAVGSPILNQSAAATSMPHQQHGGMDISLQFDDLSAPRATPPLLEPLPPPPINELVPKRKTAQPPIAKPVTAAIKPPSPLLAAQQQPKAAWATTGAVDDVGKKQKQGPAPMSLREIQEAEARQHDARKAPRDKERPAPTRVATEEIFTTTSWGLPTSQVGAARPARDASPVTPGGAPASAGPVWTSTQKAPATKKTMKEIQEEEERKKRVAVKDSEVIASAKRAYAQTTVKAAPVVGGVWATVGSSGKPAAGAPAARPVPVSQPSTSGTARPANGVPLRPTTSQHAKQPSISGKEEPFVPPSNDFMKWLREALKDLNTVNLDEFMRLLLTFPVDPKDPSVIEMIADQVYMYSSTMDGRRFASEFCTRRKADASGKKSAPVTNPVAKQTALAEAVVKTQPKAQQPASDWKPATKKKGKTGKTM